MLPLRVPLVEPKRLAVPSESQRSPAKPGAPGLRGERGKRLALARQQAGLTQREVARELGVEQNNVYRWEHGKTWPRDAMMGQLLALYGVSEKWVLFGGGQTEEPPYAAWREFKSWLERRPEGKLAEEWMIESLRRFRTPDHLVPTLETYQRLLYAMLSIEGDSDE